MCGDHVHDARLDPAPAIDRGVQPLMTQGSDESRARRSDRDKKAREGEDGSGPEQGRGGERTLDNGRRAARGARRVARSARPPRGTPRGPPPGRPPRACARAAAARRRDRPDRGPPASAAERSDRSTRPIGSLRRTPRSVQPTDRIVPSDRSEGSDGPIESLRRTHRRALTDRSDCSARPIGALRRTPPISTADRSERSA